MYDTPDLSNLISMLNNKGVDINSIMQNFNNNSTNSNNIDSAPSLDEILYSNSSNNSNKTTTSQNNDFQMPDMETITKIMKIMNSLNKNTENPSANLLYSLKPFLRDSKKEKVDQYIKFLKISSVFSEINKSGGDFK